MTMLLGRDEVAANAIHVIIADNQSTVRGAWRQALALSVPDATIGEAGDLASLSRELAQADIVDLVLLDLAMPGVSGFPGLLYLRSQHPEVPVVVVSATEDTGIMRRSVDVGAAGFIPKSAGMPAMQEAIRTVLDGGIWVPDDLEPAEAPDAQITDMMRRLASLTPQQLRVLMMLSQGLLNKQIAYALTVSEATVKAHVSAILQKLGVESRTQAVLAVSKIEHGQFAVDRRKDRD